MRGAVIVLLLSIAVGCSSEDPPKGTDDGGACVRYPGAAALATKTVPRAKVTEIFDRSCAFTSCHGRSPGSGKLFIPKSPENWYAEVVNKASVLHPTMKRVVPGDPGNSFLMHKLTTSLCALHKDCTAGSCGDVMPQGSDPLPKEDFATIETWIREGAAE